MDNRPRWDEDRKGVGGTQQGPREFPDPPDDAHPPTSVSAEPPHEHLWQVAGNFTGQGSEHNQYVAFGCQCGDAIARRVRFI